MSFYYVEGAQDCGWSKLQSKKKWPGGGSYGCGAERVAMPAVSIS
jgi:hypothetical protein